MRFARAFGGFGFGDAPGQFYQPWGIAVVRGLLVVSDHLSQRLQVLTPKGVPLQVLNMGDGVGNLRGLCADEQRVWATDVDNFQVHALKVN